MKRLFINLLIASCLFLSMQTFLHATFLVDTPKVDTPKKTSINDNFSADDVLKMARNQDDGYSYFTQVLLRLIGQTSRVRERHFRMLQKDMAGEERALMHFTAPGDIRGVAFLIANYPEHLDKLDDQWMYLPAFRKVRRIASNDKRGAFMGSTFNYSDLDKIRVKDYHNTLLGEPELNGYKTWHMERKPVSQAIINKTGYHKVELWIDKKTKHILQQHFYNQKGQIFKTQETKAIELIEGIWTITHSYMKNHDNGKASEMLFSDTRYNISVDDNMLSQRALRKTIKKPSS